MKHKAKDVGETRRMVPELVSRIKTAEDLTGEPITDSHARTVMLGFLDDQTRSHTVDYHGTDKSFDEFKNAALKFANNASLGSGSYVTTPMQIGAVAAPEAPSSGGVPCYYDLSSGSREDSDGRLWAIKGNPKTLCWECGGEGHRRANRPNSW